MRRLLPTIAILLGWTLVACAQAPSPLMTLRAVRAVTHEEASKRPYVTFEATVTYRRQGESSLFVQDGDSAIYVWAPPAFKPIPGDRVIVRGKLKDSFRPIVLADNIKVIRHDVLPKAIPASYEDLIRSRYDCMLVTVRAVVHSADLSSSYGRDAIHMYLLADGGVVDAWEDSTDASAIEQLLDAEVKITGVSAARLDGRMEQVGAGLAVPSLAEIKILKRSKQDAWSLPVTQMGNILDTYHINNLTQRVRIEGTITYYQPGTALVIQSGDKSLWVRTHYEKPLHIGFQASVTGFPDVHDGFLTLTDSEIQESQKYLPITPVPVNRGELTSSRNVFNLVSVEGKVVTEVRENAQDVYVLVSDGRVLSVVYRHPAINGGNLWEPMTQTQTGAIVRVTGICIPESSNPFKRDVPFNILIRTPADMTTVAGAPLLNVRNLTLVAGLLLLVMIAVGIRGWAMERKVRQKAAALSVRIEAEAERERRTAHLEQQRSRILEDINGSRPLAEILEEISKLISFLLCGAPCWCEVADGARLGDHLIKVEVSQLVRAEIPSRSGAPLGTLFTVLDEHSNLRAHASEHLSIGASLATLAIETRRLYSDLLRRSEFDLLTDIHNRFSLDKQLDAQIEAAREDAGIFGLIYIDLDKFKQVNDQYGHHTGDLILQEAAKRMKRQLRTQDMLARLGGDEFAAVVPVVHNREEVEEIALRLERCFSEAFTAGQYVLHGSASIGIAMYPEDGADKDSLLNFADASMYVAKHIKKKLGIIPDDVQI